MPWTDPSKPAPKPRPWDAPEPAKPDSGAPDGGRPARAKNARPPWAHKDGPSRISRPFRPPSSSGPSSSGPSPSGSSPGKSPPDRRAAAPPPRGPHLDQLRRELAGGLQRALGASGGRSLRAGLAAGLAAALIGGWLLSGVYEVQPDETGVVTRFGAYVGQAAPGLHYHLPCPIEAVQEVSADAVEQLSLGGDGAGLQALTRDGGLVSLGVDVRWRAADPVRYLFAEPDRDAALRLAALSAVRQAVGRSRLEELANRRPQAALDAARTLQARLDREHIGVRVIDLQLREIAPPDMAQPGFRDLAAAGQDAATALRDAAIYRSRALADARGDAAAAVHAAEGQRAQETAEARGEAARFELVDAEYRKAPEVTRERLYSETMARVLHGAPKVVIPPSRSGAPLALPPELFQPRSDASAPAAKPPARSEAP